jgi:hypothetical protein
MSDPHLPFGLSERHVSASWTPIDPAPEPKRCACGTVIAWYEDECDGCEDERLIKELVTGESDPRKER